jgi:hypothetical protein
MPQDLRRSRAEEHLRRRSASSPRTRSVATVCPITGKRIAARSNAVNTALTTLTDPLHRSGQSAVDRRGPCGIASGAATGRARRTRRRRPRQQAAVRSACSRPGLPATARTAMKESVPARDAAAGAASAPLRFRRVRATSLARSGPPPAAGRAHPVGRAGAPPGHRARRSRRPPPRRPSPASVPSTRSDAVAGSRARGV